MSKEDALTGLANRRAFDEYWHQVFDEARQSGTDLQVAILDIDHFKRINDHYSHLVGDQIIQRVGRLLLREQTQLCHVARWGGEEFTLLLAGKPADGYRYFDGLRQRIAALDLSDIAPSLNITVSIGVASNHQASDYVDGLKQADQALYRAKRDGRNCVRQSDNTAS
jgi:diguanylate cyclase (GGDEF) domain